MADAVSAQPDFTEHAVEVVAAYISNNHVQPGDLPTLIRSVHASLAGLGQTPAPEAAAEALRPAVPVKKSITDEYLISLEDGRRFKSLKRHLATEHGMTPADYRAKWGLPSDYPMVAPAYAAKRSALARDMGLGRKAAVAPAPAPQPEHEAAAPAPKRGRKKAA